VFYEQINDDDDDDEMSFEFTPSTTKSMVVRSTKCHFVSEQQLININYKKLTLFKYCKET